MKRSLIAAVAAAIAFAPISMFTMAPARADHPSCMGQPPAGHDACEKACAQPGARGCGGGSPVQEQAPGDDNGGRCDWANAISVWQYGKCYVHYGPQTLAEYEQEQDKEQCHIKYGTDPDHIMCPSG
jgi:hypothetical protein